MNNIGTDQITDDTDLSLVDRTNFQTLDSTPVQEVDAFVGQVDELSKDKVHFARNPYVRLGVGVAFLFFVLGFGSLFMLGGKDSQVSEVEETTPETQELTLDLNPEVADSSSSAEVDALRSELALMQQQMALAEVDRRLQPQTDSTEANTTTKQPTKPPTTTTTTRPASSTTRPTAVARPAPVSRPVSAVAARPPRPIMTAEPRTASIPTPITRAPTFSRQTPDLIDPNEAWYAASNSGVMGIMPERRAAESTAVVQGVPVAAEPEYRLKSGQANSSAKPTEYETAYDVETVAVESSQNSEAIPGLIYSGPAYIPVGRAVEATVITPISWLGSDDQFMIQLDEDVLSDSDDVAIPAGTYVIVQPMSVDESSGVGELAAVGLSIDEQVTPIDYSLVAIRGEGGSPLLADRFGDIGGDIAANDVELFAIGALGGIGNILTRPTSQSTVNGAFGSSSNTEFGDRNILGAILQGGSEQIAGRMADRNDERLNDLRSRGPIFYLDAGKKLQFYVNSGFFL